MIGLSDIINLIWTLMMFLYVLKIKLTARGYEVEWKE